MSVALKEALKEFIRVGVFGAIVAFGYAAIPVIQGMLGSCSLDACVFNWNAVLLAGGIAAGTAFLRAIEKLFHKLGYPSPLDMNNL